MNSENTNNNANGAANGGISGFINRDSQKDILRLATFDNSRKNQGAKLPWERKTAHDKHGRSEDRTIFLMRRPLYRTKSGQFDKAVNRQTERLKQNWPSLMKNVEIAIEDVPPFDPLAWEKTAVPAGICYPAEGRFKARIVLFRLPIQNRTDTFGELCAFVRDELVSGLAELYNMYPEDIDPDWRQ